MLELIVEKRVIYVFIGGAVILGIVSKCISNVVLKQLVRAAGNMSKSNHSFMRLVRAKFEHACMVSEKVENVPVFVDKYLYEYKVLGMKLYSWRRLEKICVGLCFVLGLAGVFFEYSLRGMQEQVIRMGAYAGILGVLLYLFLMTTDENYRLSAARNYMVDYLENVCVRRYEKAQQKEEKIRIPEVPETPVPMQTPPIQQPAAPSPQEIPDVTPPVKAAFTEAKNPEKEKKEEKKPDRDVLIRQILEEFMA